MNVNEEYVKTLPWGPVKFDFFLKKKSLQYESASADPDV